MTSLDLWIVAGYLVASLLVGIALARRASGSLEDFFVGGRTLPWWLAGTSMAATTFSIDTPLYVAGVVATRGIAGNWEWWSFGVAHVVLLYVFARLWRRAEVVTDNELSELRYGGRPAAILRGVKGFLFAGVLGPIALSLSMLAMVKVVDALGVMEVLGFAGEQDRLWAVVAISVLVLVYAGISGLWGVVVTDFVQFVLGMAGALLVAWAAVSHLGGLGALVDAAAAVETVDLLAFTPVTWGDGGRIVWSAAAGISASTFLAYVGLQWWAFRRSDGGGEFVQRLAAARTEEDAQKAAWLFNLLHYVVRTWPWIIVALAAVVIYPDLADPEQGYPRLMLDFLPTGLLGLVVASLVAAFMSTVSTTINWSASYLTNDLYVRFLRPHATASETVAAARVTSVLVTVLGAAAAFYSENVTTLFRLIIAMGTGPGLVLILRWFWWRINAWAELSAMVAGFIVGLGTSVVPVLVIPDFGLRLLVTAGITTAIWVPVMLLTRPESPERLDTFYRKVRPGGPGWALQRRRTGVEPDSGLGADLGRVGAGLMLLFGSMFAVGAAVLQRPTTAFVCAVVAAVGVAILRWIRRRTLASGSTAMLAVGLLALAAGASPAAAQQVELQPGEGAGVPLSRWLAGRFPGLQVLASSGAPGSAPRLRIRGPGSLSLTNEPVVVLDGMRIDGDGRSTTIGVGGQAPSRLDDIPVTSLAGVEVLRGPAAMARWGAGAANGVIVLTSRAGHAASAGPDRVRAWGVWGRTADVARRPANWFGREGTGACFAYEQALGRCDQTELQVFAPLDDPASIPFAGRTIGAVGAQADASVRGATVHIRGSWDVDRGVLAVPEFEEGASAEPPDGGVRRSADVGVAFDPLERLRVHASLAITDGRVDRPFDGNDFAGIHPAGLLGFAEGGAEADFGYRLFRPSQVYGRDLSQEWTRWRAATNTTFEWTPGLRSGLVLGFERTTRRDVQMVPPGLIGLGSELPRGIADRNRTVLGSGTARLTTDATWDTSWGGGSTGVYAELWSSDFDRQDRGGVGLPAGGGTVEDAEDRSSFDLDGERRIAAVGVRQGLDWQGWLNVDGGLRVESNRALGRDWGTVVLPFAELEAAPGRDGGPAAGWWPAALSVRAAWGRGVHVPGRDGRGLDRVALAPDAPLADPERTTSWELAASTQWFDDRLDLELTRYDRTTDGLLLRSPLLFAAAAQGARYDPVGDLRNRGWELQTRWRIHRGAARWMVDVGAAWNDNEVLALDPLPGEDAPPEIRQGVQWTVVGHPVGGYWAQPLRWDDRDGDGVLVPSEINVDTEARFLGTPHPRLEVGIGSTWSYRDWTVHTRWIHRGGHRLRNLTEGYRCQVTLCRGFNDATAPLADQARAQAVAIFPPDFFTEAGFIEDASFWRWAEVGVRWQLRAFAPAGGDLALSLLGQNLATWTDYSGMDPEVNQFGAVDVLARDFMTQPPVRRWTVRVDVAARPW